MQRADLEKIWVRTIDRDVMSLDSPCTNGNSKETERLIAAIRVGCTAADLHLCCSYPDCTCKQIPAAIEAALNARCFTCLSFMKLSPGHAGICNEQQKRRGPYEAMALMPDDGLCRKYRRRKA